MLASKTTAALASVPGVTKAASDQVVHIVRSSGGAAISSLHALPNGTAIVNAASGAAVDAARTVSFVAAGFIFLGLLATLALPHIPAEDAVEAEEAPAPSSD
jgi:hypothetical protein